MAYCGTADVREVTNISTDEVSNSKLSDLIDRACIKLNNLINVRHKKIKVEYINSYRENDIDGSNKTFFTGDYPLGDTNDDFSVGTADVEMWSIDASANRTDYTISSVDASLGKVVLNSAPPADETLYIKYEYCPVELSNEILKEAAINLSAYYAIRRLQGRGYDEYKLGSLKIKHDRENVGQPFKQDAFNAINDIRREKMGVKEADKFIEDITIQEDGVKVV